ncbi:MAG: hypothetical protein ACFFDN_17445 [Candidatus Hodarchaeota archaeon]
MSVKAFYCDQCGSPIDFSGDSNVICQTCGVNNVNVEAERAIMEARTLAETYLGNLEELENRLKASGDATARDYIFTKDFKPRLDVVFENLMERFDEYFRRPIFNLTVLKGINPLYDVTRIFNTEIEKGYSKHFTRDLNQFAMGQLELPVMKLLAASETSQKHILTLKHHTMFLSRLYNIRGLALNLKTESLNSVKNLINLIIGDCEILEKQYSEIKDGNINQLRFLLWQKRFKINLKILDILQKCLNQDFDQIINQITEVMNDIDNEIKDIREKSAKEEERYPLFIVLVSIEGFSIDKKILGFLAKLLGVKFDGNFQMDFLSFLSQTEKILRIANRPFVDTKLPQSEWDEFWITSLEEPFARVYQLLDNLVLNRKIITGEIPVYKIDMDIDMFEPWEENQIVIGKNLKTKYYNLKSDYSVKSKIPINIPIAALSVYAILKKGFIKKGGDEFESFLLVNPYFKFDPVINNYGYANAFSYIDIEESLKENDPMKNQLRSIESKIESGVKDKINQDLTLPLLITNREIEEFVQKTYDLFELVQEGTTPIPKFKQIYKNVGIAKKVEKLSGELLDFIYVPALLLEIAEGTSKKGDFQTQSQYQWKLLLPFTDPKNPWDNFLRMNITPSGIMDISAEIQKLT